MSTQCTHVAPVQRRRKQNSILEQFDLGSAAGPTDAPPVLCCSTSSCRGEADKWSDSRELCWFCCSAVRTPPEFSQTATVRSLLAVTLTLCQLLVSGNGSGKPRERLLATRASKLTALSSRCITKSCLGHIDSTTTPKASFCLPVQSSPFWHWAAA
jgi:hypothetical protein